jgi:hypothetical protein
VEDWVWISFALAIASGAFFFVGYTALWLMGAPGPFLWFSNPNILRDILTAVGALMVATFLINFFGACAIMAVVRIRDFLRSRQT